MRSVLVAACAILVGCTSDEPAPKFDDADLVLHATLDGRATTGVHEIWTFAVQPGVHSVAAEATYRFTGVYRFEFGQAGETRSSSESGYEEDHREGQRVAWAYSQLRPGMHEFAIWTNATGEAWVGLHFCKVNDPRTQC